MKEKYGRKRTSIIVQNLLWVNEKQKEKVKAKKLKEKKIWKEKKKNIIIQNLLWEKKKKKKEGGRCYNKRGKPNSFNYRRWRSWSEGRE